jgi:hypothetical protein
MPSNCANCGVGFSVEPEETEWLSANGKDGPSLCPRCRAFKTGLQDESITCTVCGRVFIFPRELRLFSRMFNWPRPRRCLGGCKRQGPPLTEVESHMADFLRRMRTARRTAGLSRFALQNVASSSLTQRTPAVKADEAGGGPQLGGSLAQALKEFQEKKRRRS